VGRTWRLGCAAPASRGSSRSGSIGPTGPGGAGGKGYGPATASLTDLDDPRIDWVRLAYGFGVPARRVGSAEELTAALTWAQTESGPHLVQATL